MANEVTVVILPPEYAHLSPMGQLRSDQLPHLGNVTFAVMEVLDQPEPIPEFRKQPPAE
jgi:hypothetical protein